MAAARGEIAPTGAGEANFDSTINPNLEESSTDKCQRIIRLLYELNLSFGEFSVAVCYGDPLLRSDIDCISAHKSLYQTECFEQLLENSYHPPLPPSGGGRRPVAGGKILDSFAQEVIERKFAKELEAFSEGFTIDDKDLANIDKMKMYSSKLLHEQIQKKCPSLFTMLCNLTDMTIPEEPKNTGEGEDEDDDKDIGTPGLKAPPKKDPYFGIVIQVASLAYRHNQHHNALQKYLSIYMQAQHLSKSAFFLLQQAGIVMSYSWT
ncbi:hypothetical protein B0J17DRAFT_722445 [Rhizoctonia solani]|nr:hypothetical protein B0J17DRAFT_722445 [Rhizoctonia solani]